jgi:glycosyltransferase involved in cell wall biosynthesis
MIYVFHPSDPLVEEPGLGAERFRALHRALRGSGLPYRLVGTRLQPEDAAEVDYIATGPGRLRFHMALWLWFWRRRGELGPHDVFHFHRNRAAWPKLLLCPALGHVLISHDASAAPPHPAQPVPAACDPALFARREASPPPPHLATRLLFLGRISHQTNVALAIDTLEQLVGAGGDYTLTIAGAGEDSGELIRRLARSPVSDRVRWLGGAPPDDVPRLLAQHGILLLTSRYEASPGVVRDALRSLRPVVSTDVGDVADWVEPERTGWVCPATAAALAEGVRAATRLILEGRYGQSRPPAAPDERQILARVLRLYRWLAAV